MAQSSPEGIVLGKGSTLVSAEVSINEEKVLDGLTMGQILENEKTIEEPKQFKGRGMLHYSGKIIGGEPKQENTAEYIDRHIVEAMVEVAKQKMYSEEEVEDLIYKVCGTVARLQGITLNGNHIDTAYKQFKKK